MNWIKNQSQRSTIKIPFHNVNLNGARFIDLLKPSNQNEYIIQDNHLTIESFPCRGNVLLKTN